MSGSIVNGAKLGKPFKHYYETDQSGQVEVVKLHPDDAALLGGGNGTVVVKELQATTVAETTVSADNTNKALLAADSTRRRFVVINPTGASTKLGLTTNASATFAQCPIVLSPGEMWVESLAAASAWRCIMESGTATVPVQTAV